MVKKAKFVDVELELEEGETETFKFVPINSFNSMEAVKFDLDIDVEDGKAVEQFEEGDLDLDSQEMTMEIVKYLFDKRCKSHEVVFADDSTMEEIEEADYVFGQLEDEDVSKVMDKVLQMEEFQEGMKQGENFRDGE